jgi:5-methylcytosine-specific restriction endonuclease McrA
MLDRKEYFKNYMKQRSKLPRIKELKKINNKKYRETHKNKISKYLKNYYQNNRELWITGKYKQGSDKWRKSLRGIEYCKQQRKINKEKYRKYIKIWYQLNKEKIIERSKQWVKDNKDRRKLYLENNKEKLRENSKIYKLTHPEKVKEWANNWKNNPNRKKIIKLWRQSPKGKYCLKKYDNNRRIKEKDLTIEIIKNTYEDNIKQYGCLTCYLCLKPIEFGQDSLEHKIPLSKGGNNKRENLDIAHRLCNSKKGTKTLDEILKRLTVK